MSLNKKIKLLNKISTSEMASTTGIICDFLNRAPNEDRGDLASYAQRYLEKLRKESDPSGDEAFDAYNRLRIRRVDFRSFFDDFKTIFDDPSHLPVLCGADSIGNMERMFLPEECCSITPGFSLTPREIIEVLGIEDADINQIVGAAKNYVSLIEEPGEKAETDVDARIGKILDFPNQQPRRVPHTPKTIVCSIQPYARTLVVPAILYALENVLAEQGVRLEWEYSLAGTIEDQIDRGIVHIAYCTKDIETQEKKEKGNIPKCSISSLNQNPLQLVALAQRFSSIPRNAASVRAYNFLGYFGEPVHFVSLPHLPNVLELKNERLSVGTEGALVERHEYMFIGGYAAAGEKILEPELIIPSTETYIWGVQAGLIHPLSVKEPISAESKANFHVDAVKVERNTEATPLALYAKFPSDNDSTNSAEFLNAVLVRLHNRIIEKIEKEVVVTDDGGAIDVNSITTSPSCARMDGALLSVLFEKVPEYDGVLTKMPPGLLSYAAALGPRYLDAIPTWYPKKWIKDIQNGKRNSREITNASEEAG